MGGVEQGPMTRTREKALVRVVRDLAAGVSANGVEGDHAAARERYRDRRVAGPRILEVQETLRLEIAQRADPGAGRRCDRGGRRSRRRAGLGRAGCGPGPGKEGAVARPEGWAGCIRFFPTTPTNTRTTVWEFPETAPFTGPSLNGQTVC